MTPFITCPKSQYFRCSTWWYFGGIVRAQTGMETAIGMSFYSKCVAGSLTL